MKKKKIWTDWEVLYKHNFSLWASYQIHKIAGCACAGNARNVFPRRRIQRKTRVSDPGMHHGTCVTHVPWCMSGLLTHGGGENVPGIPGACAPAILRIWQEAHGRCLTNGGAVIGILEKVSGAFIMMTWHKTARFHSWSYHSLAPSHWYDSCAAIGQKVCNNGSSPFQHEAIIWTNAAILSIKPFG